MSVRPVSLIVLLTLLVSTLAAALAQAVPAVSFANDPGSLAPAAITPTASIALAPIGTFAAGAEGAAEIVTYDPVGRKLYVINGATDKVDVVDIANPAAPAKISEIDLAAFGASPTSAAFHSYGPGATEGLLAVAVVNADPQQPGKVAFFDRNGSVVRGVTVGSLPDMVTFTPDGSKVLVANEGEPSSDYTVDPEGSISIIQVGTPAELRQEYITFLPIVARSGATIATTQGSPRAASWQIVKTASFVPFNDDIDALRAAGVRIFGPNATAAQDFEPEYITVSADSQTAYATLQENNAVAVIDIASATVSAIVPLSTKDYNQTVNALDASDRDNTINITTWPVKGMYQPDAIASYQASGATYLVTANEGDARAYDAFNEETRVRDVTLDPTIFPNAATLRDNVNLGRLRITNTRGDTDGDGDYDELYAFGARSFSIWNASGQLVYDSGSQFEQITAANNPAYFNANYNTDTNVFEFDTRSDDKGPEPEGVTVGVINERTYAFVGLERSGGVMIYDVTDPTAPAFVQYVNNVDFTGSIADGSARDVSPEGLIFIPAADSPTGQPLLVVTHELSGTTTIYSITTPDSATTLTLLHNNDGESSLLPIQYSVNPGTGPVQLDVGGVAAFATVTRQNINAARTARNSVVNVYAGDAFLASATLQCSLDAPDGPVYDALAQRQIPYDAHIIGNHEFDYSPDFLERFIRSFTINGVLNQPFLSANLDFSNEPGYANLTDADGLIEGYSTDGRVVAKSAIIIDELTGKRFGIVSATTPALATISSPRNVQVTTSDLAQTAAVVQTEIDRLTGKGINKIIFVSHLQDVTNDKTLIPQLRGVDVAVAGGGDELLTNKAVSNDLQLLPGETAPVAGDYPTTVTDGDGRTVYIVTTAGNYKYLGRLDLVFNDAGEITGVVNESSYPRPVIPTSANATALGLTNTVTPDANIISSVVTPVQGCLEALDEPIVRTEVLLDVSNPGGVRNKETNAGNLVADSYLYIYDQLDDLNDLPPRSTENRVIAVQNGGGIRQNAGPRLPTSGVVPGTISRLDTRNVLAFFNTMSVVQNVTPADLKQIFERSLSSLPNAGGQFLQIAGVRVEYDPAGTAQVITSAGTVTTEGQRVINITLEDGTPIISNGAVAPGAPNVSIVTNTFTATGGDNYPWLKNNPNQTQLFDENGVTVTYDQTWVRYLLTFPVEEGFPTIQSDDVRYQVGGEGRITTVTP